MRKFSNFPHIVFPTTKGQGKVMGDLGSEHGFLLLLIPVHLADGIFLWSSSSGPTSLPISRSLFHQGDLKTRGFGKINKLQQIMPSIQFEQGILICVSLCHPVCQGLRDISCPMHQGDEGGLGLCALLSVVPGVLWQPQHRVLTAVKAPDFLSLLPGDTKLQ